MKTPFYASVIFALILLGNIQNISAQIDEEDRPTLNDEFCKLLRYNMNAKQSFYASLVDTSKNEYEEYVGFDEVRDEATFMQASSNIVVGRDQMAKFRAVFMTRDDKDALLPSYKNLQSMLKDCLFFEYGFTDKIILGQDMYECTGKPLQISGEPQAILVLFIEKNWERGTYNLVLEMR